MVRHRKSALNNTIKDYIVPIIWGIILLLLILKLFSSGDETWNTTIETQNSLESSAFDISYSSPSTEAFISYPWDKQEQITDSIDLYSGETLIVKQWIVKLNSSLWTSIALNKIAELEYTSANNFSLYSSDAWFQVWQDTNISMRYANIQATDRSIFSLTQNEAGSTLYLLSGSAKVSNLEGVSTVISSGQKISISRQNASNKDLDIVNEKWDIDSYFKSSDWFLENNGPVILAQSEAISVEANSNESDNNENTEVVGQEWIFVSFDTLRDEMNIESWLLQVSGSVNSVDVWAITINNVQAPIAESARTFTLSDIQLQKWVNDIVVKVFTNSQDILEKKVFTVYSTNWETPTNQSVTSNSNNVASVNSQWVRTYSVDATDFWFTQPSVTWKFSTTSPEVTIRWVTTAEWIAKVEVNGFELWSFNGSTWRYHAFERFETLEEGTNQYKIDYYGEDDSIVYTDYYTIVKQSTTPVPVETEWEGDEDTPEEAA